MKKKSLLVVWTLLFAGSIIAQEISDRIKLNQIGFYPARPKIAVITGELDATDFFITTTNLKDTFFRGKLSEVRQSVYSKTTTHLADFSKLNQRGVYVLTVPGIGYSYSFKIADDVFNDVGIATLKGFYFQRISMPLDEKYAGKWNRPAGHPDNVVLIHPSAASD